MRPALCCGRLRRRARQGLASLPVRACRAARKPPLSTSPPLSWPALHPLPLHPPPLHPLPHTEDHLFGDKERFVTAAYKAKLAERAAYVEEQKKK